MIPPAPEVARPVAVVLMLGIGMIHCQHLLEAFRQASYIGVQTVLALLLVVAGAFWMIAEERSRVWWFALVQGVLNAAGYVVSRAFGLPLTSWPTEGDWLHATSLALGFLGLVLTALAGWVLLSRRALARRGPVLSARERWLLPAPPPKRPEE